MFFCGTTSPGTTDKFITKARVWIQAVVKAAVQQRDAGGACTVPLITNDDFTADVNAATTQLSKRSTEASQVVIPPKPGTPTGTPDPDLIKKAVAVLDGHLGGLRGHSLVFVTHGLEPDHNDLTANGILFRNDNKNGDTLFCVLHLTMMKVENDVVVAKSTATTDNLPEFIGFVNALRKSVFQRVYLCACGPQARLKEFAANLSLLADVDVFYNNHRVWVSDQKQPYATVDDDTPANGEFVTGRRYFSMQSVNLITKTDTYFEGAELLQSRPKP